MGVETDESMRPKESRRISLTTLNWLTGKVEQLRKKFAAVNLEQTTDRETLKKRTMRKIENNGTRKGSESDGDLVEMCRKYQICSNNRYTWISEPFETIVMDYGELMQANNIKIHRGSFDGENEPPRGLLLLPLSASTGQALLDFTEMGGYSLGRGSRVAKTATRALSRTHCMIYLENNCVYIKDCDSKTGTFVNGKLLGSSSATALGNFDIIQMGYGHNFEDYIQSMVIFLDKWNPKEFASIIQQLNSPARHSRTFSNSVSDLQLAAIEAEQQKKNSHVPLTTTSPLISSPKLTKITDHLNYSKPPVKSKPIVEAESETHEEEEIVFERPQPKVIVSEPTIQDSHVYRRAAVESPKNISQQPPKASAIPQQSPRNTPAISQSPRNTPVISQSQIESPTISQLYNPSAISSPRKAAETPKAAVPTSITETTNTSASSRIEASLVQKSPTRSAVEEVPLSSSPRSPKPKPRRVQKGLSKSAECLIEVELEEIVEEVEQRKKETNSSAANSKITAKMPIESALAARRSSLTPQVLNVAIPEFLKSENLKVPASSPAQDLLRRAKMMLTSGQEIHGKKLNLPVNKGRKYHLDKFRNEAQFTTIVQGAETKRFESFVDFGAATSDISDGLAESQLNRRESVQMVFNNFRVTWMMESLNRTSGNKLILQANKSNNEYSLAVEGRTEGSILKIGRIEMSKNFLKMSFQIDDEIYKGITGKEIDTKSSLPIKALQQLTYFYPHLELPSVEIEGPVATPSDKVTISLSTSKQVQPIGRIVFEGQKVSWTKRQMFYAVDLDTQKVEIDSLLCDAIQSAALLYCLRYHID